MCGMPLACNCAVMRVGPVYDYTEVGHTPAQVAPGGMLMLVIARVVCEVLSCVGRVAEPRVEHSRAAAAASGWALVWRRAGWTR